MISLVRILIFVMSASAAPGYLTDIHGEAPTYLPAPTILKSPSIFTNALPPTFIKTAAPVYPAPVVKAVAPATSYASVTQLHVVHPQTVIKTIVAPQPLIAQPVLKSFALPAPVLAHGHDFAYH